MPGHKESDLSFHLGLEQNTEVFFIKNGSKIQIYTVDILAEVVCCLIVNPGSDNNTVIT